MGDTFKRIIATIVLFTLYWMVFYLNQYIIWGQVFEYDQRLSLLQSLKLLVFVVIVSVVFLVIWCKTLRLSYDSISDYVTPPVTFYLLDVLTLFVFCKMGSNEPLVGEGLHWHYAEPEVYCCVIGFIYALFYMGVLLIKEAREKKS